MISNTEKERIKRKFSENINSSKCIFLFDGFEFRNEIVSALALENITLNVNEVFLIYYQSVSQYAIITNSSFVIVKRSEAVIIEFSKIKSIKVDATPMLVFNSKERIDKILINTVDGSLVYLEFLHDADLALYSRILSNISFGD